MRVLLISPVASLDPPCGDITYTETLLAHSPEEVLYETYDQAIRRGALVEHAKSARFSEHPVLTLANKAVNILRHYGVLFWEPFRFFSVRDGEYDLIHLHVFNARFLHLPCPLMVSSGAPQPDLYRDRRGYSSFRVAITSWVERRLARLMKVNCNSFDMPQAAGAAVYTSHFRDYLVNGGYLQANQVSIVPIMLEAGAPITQRAVPRRIGFIANNFEEKGGPVLLEAFEIVLQKRPDAELWVVGCEPKLSDQESKRRNIVWTGRVSRKKLREEIIPSFDVFAYPTPHDCFSYVMLEAMAGGVAIATSDYVSMPEAVDYGKAGLVSPVGDPTGLAENILLLLDPSTNAHFRRAARNRFEEHFSVEAVWPKLLGAYRSAVESTISHVH